MIAKMPVDSQVIHPICKEREAIGKVGASHNSFEKSMGSPKK